MGKKIPLWQAGLVMLFMVISLMYSMGLLFKLTKLAAFKCEYGEAHIPLIASALVAALVAILNGYKWKYLEAGILSAINRSMQAMLILMVVGLLIGSWVAAGVVPAMIYYGLMILKPSIFLIAGCILCAIVALSTGSSWTTAGTIGIALVGVGQGLGIDPAITAGAIVSGAYFGDKMSPLSDTTNLAPAVAGSNLFDHIRHMAWTVTPSLVIALIIFGIIGAGHSGEVDTSVLQSMQGALKENFTINVWMLVPPLIVILIVALKIPALPGLFGGIIVGCIIGSIFQGITLADWPGIIHHGFKFPEELIKAKVIDQNIVDLLHERGGMESMLGTINLILCAMTFGGILDASGMLGTLAHGLLKLVRNTGSLAIVTVVSCITMNILAADQYLAIILPGRMYKETWEDQKLDPKNLSRCLEDSGTMTSSLVPWNTCGATMTKFLGVRPWGGPGGGYGRYAFLNLINPIVSIFYAFTGISMTKMTDEQYAKILEDRAKEKADAAKALEA